MQAFRHKERARCRKCISSQCAAQPLWAQHLGSSALVPSQHLNVQFGLVGAALLPWCQGSLLGERDDLWLLVPALVPWSTHFFQEPLLQSVLAVRNRNRDTIAQLNDSAGGQNCHSGHPGASPILTWSKRSFGKESLKALCTVLPLLSDCALGEALAVPFGVPVLSSRGSPSFHSGCVVISHKRLTHILSGC